LTKAPALRWSERALRGFPAPARSRFQFGASGWGRKCRPPSTCLALEVRAPPV
jgi:hypothetical protein